MGAVDVQRLRQRACTFVPFHSFLSLITRCSSVARRTLPTHDPRLTTRTIHTCNDTRSQSLYHNLLQFREVSCRTKFSLDSFQSWVSSSSIRSDTSLGAHQSFFSRLTGRTRVTLGKNYPCNSNTNIFLLYNPVKILVNSLQWHISNIT